VPGIDLLRGLSIVAVVLHHINLRIHFHDSVIGKLLGRATDRVLFWSGYYGVCVFFVISGFLITTWSLKRWGSLRQIERRQFYVMRFARIVPCLAGLLVLLSILDRAGVPRFIINKQHTSLGRALLAALTFHINWLEAQRGYLPANWDVLWSLSIEEVFYLGFPLVCLLTKKRRVFVCILGVFTVSGPSARVLSHNEYWRDNGYLSGMDAIAIGCVAALFATRFPLTSSVRRVLKWTGALVVAFATLCKPWANNLGLYKHGLDVTAIALGTAMMLVCFGQEQKQGGRATAWLRWFGRNSYEIYLTHMMAIFALLPIAQRFGRNGQLAPLWYLLMIAASGLLGAAIARFFSEPLNRKLRSEGRTAERIAVRAATAE